MKEEYEYLKYLGQYIRHPHIIGRYGDEFDENDWNDFEFLFEYRLYEEASVLNKANLSNKVGIPSLDNESRLRIKKQYEKNTEMQAILSNYEIDTERFWYLLLFIFDWVDTAQLEDNGLRELLHQYNTYKGLRSMKLRLVVDDFDLVETKTRPYLDKDAEPIIESHIVSRSHNEYEYEADILDLMGKLDLQTMIETDRRALFYYLLDCFKKRSKIKGTKSWRTLIECSANLFGIRYVTYENIKKAKLHYISNVY